MCDDSAINDAVVISWLTYKWEMKVIHGIHAVSWVTRWPATTKTAPEVQTIKKEYRMRATGDSFESVSTALMTLMSHELYNVNSLICRFLFLTFLLYSQRWSESDWRWGCDTHCWPALIRLPAAKGSTVVLSKEGKYIKLTDNAHRIKLHPSWA